MSFELMEQTTDNYSGKSFIAGFMGCLGVGAAVIVVIVVILAYALSRPDEDTKTISSDTKQTGIVSAEQTNNDAKVEIIKTYWDGYRNSIGTNWAFITAVIKNVGETNADLDTASGTFYDKDGKVIGSSTETVYPRYLKPNEEAYICVSARDGPKKSEIADAKVQFEYKKTTKEPVTLIPKNDTGKLVSGYEFVVTGELENPSDKQIDDVRVLVAFFDSQDNLLCTETAYPKPEDVPAHDSVSFKVDTLHLADKVKDYKILGYSTQW